MTAHDKGESPGADVPSSVVQVTVSYRHGGIEVDGAFAFLMFCACMALRGIGTAGKQPGRDGWEIRHTLPVFGRDQSHDYFTFTCDLSAWRAADRTATPESLIDSLYKSGNATAVVVSQSEWDSFDPDARDLISKHAEARGMTILIVRRSEEDSKQG